MHARIITLLAVLAAPAFAQSYHQAVPVAAAPMPAVVQPSCGPRPAARGNNGRWELQTTQQYVPGVTQQVWVAGWCSGNPRNPWKQHCEQGRYVTTVTQGHYEARQEWVWVAMNNRHDGYAYDRDEHRTDRRGRHSRVEFNVGFH